MNGRLTATVLRLAVLAWVMRPRVAPLSPTDLARLVMAGKR